MRVRIKADMCQGHGMCALAAPELFRLSDEDGHAFILDENVAPDMRYSVAQAAASCPEGAIEVLE